MSKTNHLALHISGLYAGYPGKPVLESLTLAGISGGELTALAGPNAAGKSTLLKSIATIIPAKGIIRLNEEDLLRLSLSRRSLKTGYMPQYLQADVALTVFESLMAALKTMPATTGMMHRQQALAVLEDTNLTALAMEPLDSLSGGQRQLVSLAQAIVRRPKLLLLDEPTSALDLRHQVAVMYLIRQYAAAGNIVIMVLHDLNLAARHADRIVVLNQGKIYAEGTPEHVITPRMLQEVYGVSGRVEQCSKGKLITIIDS